MKQALVLGTAFLLLTLILYQFSIKPNQSGELSSLSPQRLWANQCIDTMKSSRDNARSWAQDPRLPEYIERELEAAKGMGANCVAIATPYDEEFVPYLETWVAAARAKGLNVWFRGNFSSWEGWFDYRADMTTREHLEKTRGFILSHRNLFEDGDIFTPAPEAENGGPFRHLPFEEYANFRKFLIDQKNVSDAAFDAIGKDVTTNWLSMSGGVAQGVLDQRTVDDLGGIVTIDHYVRTPAEMSEYILFFHEKFGAKVVLGEFGAPIPDLNGEMTEREQAQFVRSLLEELYKNAHIVEGVSYWVSLGGSTALLGGNGQEREVGEAIRDYFIPAMVYGRVKNTLGASLAGIEIAVSGENARAKTDRRGDYALILPQGRREITFRDEAHHPISQNVSLGRGDRLIENAELVPKITSLSYRFHLLTERIKARIN